MNLHYKLSPSIVARKIAGELLLVPYKDNLGDLSVMYTANEIGAKVLELLGEQRSLHEIKEALLSEYDVEEARVKKDLNDFLEQLVSLGVVT